MTVTILILFLSAILFVSGKIRSDLVAVCVALSLVLCGVLTPEEALAGFSNPVVIMMIGLFIVGGGIFSTGLAKRIGASILGLAGKNETRLFVLLMITTSVVGAFVSNTGTVALMLPIVVSIARGAGFSSSRFLMPLAFAGSMGGMLTLIGTPPNLIIRDALVAKGYEALSFFSFTPIGIVCIVVGILVLIPLSRIFLRGKEETTLDKKGNKTLEQLASEYKLNQDLTLLCVGKSSKMIGHTLKQLNLRRVYNTTVIEVQRKSKQGGAALMHIEQFALSDVQFAEGDILYVNGEASSVALLASEYNLFFVENQAKQTLRFYDVGMAEILLLSTSSLQGRTIEETEFRQKYGLNVLGIRRKNRYILDNIKDCRLQESDIILVQGPWKNIARLNAYDGQEWVVIGQPHEQLSRVTIDYKAPIAALIMLLMVIAMAFDIIPIVPVTAVMLAAVAMIFTGCLRSVEAAYKTINWESIVLFGAMLPMSTALDKTGVSVMLSTRLVQSFGGYSPYVLLAVIYLATSLLTFFISNTVTAVLMTPIALSVAETQHISAVPLLMAVSVAASMCFASPFSTPPNALVMSAGGYKAIDYIKVGLPLQVVMAIVMIVSLPLIFPF